MIKVILENKKAKTNYEIIETYEAGIELKGSEVKSIKMGKVSFKDSFIIAKRGELYIINMFIAPYEFSTYDRLDPERPRKLLLHRREIDRIIGKSKERGLTIIPLKIYQKNHLIKIEIALAKGLKKYEKKEKIKERIIEREMKRELKRIK
ncbi:MAG: SsrA-binding protein SmpB [Candidatus Hydrothermia bacterium]|jgi:SsrA-binding protein|nr:SsrA-binding protein SmpB [Candidatus Hydrothermia bacterium]